MEPKVSKAVILAAGAGSRVQPFTSYMPKTMLPYGSYPILYHQVDIAYNAGIRDVVIVSREDDEKTVLGYKNDPKIKGIFQVQNDYINGHLKGEFAKKGVKVEIVYQSNNAETGKPRGPGDAVISAERYIGKDNYAVILGDLILEPKEKGEKSLLENILSRFDGENDIVSSSVLDMDSAREGGMIRGEYCGNGLIKIMEIRQKPRKEEDKEFIDGCRTPDGKYRATWSGIYILNKYSIGYLKTATPRKDRNEIDIEDGLMMQCLDENRKTEAYAFDYKGADGTRYIERNFGSVGEWLSHNVEEKTIVRFVESLKRQPEGFQKEVAEELAKRYPDRDWSILGKNG